MWIICLNHLDFHTVDFIYLNYALEIVSIVTLENKLHNILAH